MTEPLVINSLQTTTSCVIWLHGLGATKHDFAPVVHMLRSDLPNTRFILPEAPVQKVTLNGGFPCTSWYDITAITPHRSFSLVELEQSSDMVISLIEQTIKDGVEPNKIVLAGFSQGGAVVLHTGILRINKPLGAILALSTYAPSFGEQLKVKEIKHQLPISFMHGTFDNVVPIELAKLARNKLINAGCNPTLQTYPMAHEVCEQQIQDIGNFLTAILNN